MSRLVLLGLDDSDVDVLTHIPGLDPKPEVLVIHPDPGALIVKLADLAGLSTATIPPEPREGDVVVTPTNGKTSGGLVEPWTKMGARILSPEDLVPSKKTPSTSSEKEKAMNHFKGIGDKKSSAPQKTTPAASWRATEVGHNDSPPPDVWTRPEATFRYLVGLAAGKQTPVTLWWDGGADLWVPWLWTGDSPQGTPETLDQAVEIPSSWGAFRLVGASGVRGLLKLPALSRVVDDIALRDLAVWRKEARAFAALGYPDPKDEGAIDAWAETVISPLNSEAALIWRHGDDTWQLLGTWGEGIVFGGNLVFAESLFAASFDGPDSPWHRWELGNNLCVQLMLSESDPRTPLRLNRVRQALHGENDAW